AGRRSGSGSPRRSPGTRCCCCSTSRPRRWMSRRAGTSGPRFTATPPAGRTVLFATHYLQEADDAADRVVVVAGGRKVADGTPGAIKARFGDRQVRFTFRAGEPALLRALAGVHAVDRDGPRVTLHSSDTDATRGLAGPQRAGMVGPGRRRRRPGDLLPAPARRDVMTGFMTLEMRRSLRDVRYLVVAVALPTGLSLLFTGLFGSHGQRALGLPQPVELMVAMIAYGAMWAVFSTTGPRIAHERAIGWTRQLRVTPLSPAAALSGKLVTALTAALLAMALVALTAVLSHHVHLSA